jgi:hypothetical protein
MNEGDYSIVCMSCIWCEYRKVSDYSLIVCNHPSAIINDHDRNLSRPTRVHGDGPSQPFVEAVKDASPWHIRCHAYVPKLKPGA